MSNAWEQLGRGREYVRRRYEGAPLPCPDPPDLLAVCKLVEPIVRVYGHPVAHSLLLKAVRRKEEA